MVMEVGDRKEWVWTDYNQDNLLICLRKMGYSEYTASDYVDSAEDDDSEDDSASDSDKEIGIESGEEKPIVRMYKGGSDKGSGFDNSKEEEGDEEDPRPNNTTLHILSTTEGGLDESK